ncbi:hypothetical protein ACFX1X_043389 [Malus domestica]
MWDDASVETFISICVVETLAKNQTKTGLGWDPVKQTIIASDEWWEKKVKVQIVVASMALHNFIRNHSMTYQEFQSYDDDDDDELLPPGHEEDHRDEEIVDENFTHRRELDVERERIDNLLISS